MLKNTLENELAQLAAPLLGDLADDLLKEFILSEPKSADHGDYASNLALSGAGKLHLKPRELAEKLEQAWKVHPNIESIAIAGPGFINISLKPEALMAQVEEVLSQGSQFGNVANPHPRRLHVEYVSVNPNGPITIGSGRGAAYGDTLTRIFKAAGEEVQSEYYINDALNSEQMRLFTLSVQTYLKRLNGEEAELPDNGYKGDYVLAVAKGIANQVKPDDSLVAIQQSVQEEMIRHQRDDLAQFRVEFDLWFSEQSLHESGTVQAAIDHLIKTEAADYNPIRHEVKREGKTSTVEAAAQEPGPLWFRSHRFGDEKDRVLVRTDGRPAYISGDLAYMQNKLGTRRFDLSLLILGPDHHGYIGRMNAVAQALGFDPSRFQIVIYQLVRFLKDGKLAAMRKRDGNIYELKDLYNEIGVDAARYFYIMRSHDTPLDFDIDLALKLGEDNPVFYVQYAHARICSILTKASESKFPVGSWSPEYATLLNHPKELALIKRIAELPEIVQRCAEDYQVHRIASYATALAKSFHAFYDECRVIQPDQPMLTHARICLTESARIGLARALDLVGVSAPQRMHRETHEE